MAHPLASRKGTEEGALMNTLSDMEDKQPDEGAIETDSDKEFVS